MFTVQLRKLVDLPFAVVAGRIFRTPAGVTALTLSAFAAGLTAFGCIATHRPLAGLLFLLLNRVLAGSGRSLAACTVSTDACAYLDLVLEFLGDASIPLAFALADPTHAVAAAFLLLGLASTNIARLAQDAIAAQRGFASAERGTKSSPVINRSLERVAIFLAFALASLDPAWFSIIAYALGVLCFVLMGIRVGNAVERLT
jgi:hypothetical protein